ncbi:cofilin [Dacryopinax primogenitus]|uniref:Cofilin n=1 Tax=Dacryopinax primogenitus (strain DJM 731) TaxID=1858805 RepID=M5G4R6_DACPD|nr:cofilin [Dacryopinax primogenitus]EJU03210.1 cofilin [Dacryopinax primogenitus]
MSSGIVPSADVLRVFEEDLKRNKKFKYIILGIAKVVDPSNAKPVDTIVVTKTSEEPSWDKFLAELTDTECKYAIYDFAYEVDGGGQRTKIILITWAPDGAQTKERMIFASSKAALKATLSSGIAAEVQANDLSEITFEIVRAKLGN